MQCRTCSSQPDVKGWYTCWRIQRSRPNKRLNTLYKIVLRAKKVRCCASCHRDLLSGQLSQQLSLSTCSLAKRSPLAGDFLRSSQRPSVRSHGTSGPTQRLEYVSGLLETSTRHSRRYFSKIDGYRKKASTRYLSNQK